MTDSKTSKFKEWRDTHYPIHIPLIFLGLGLLFTIYVSDTWLQPERENNLKEACPTMSEECLNTLTWEPHPLYFLIPLLFITVGFIFGSHLRYVG